MSGAEPGRFYLQLPMAVAGLLFVLATFAASYQADLGYWQSWIGELSRAPLVESSANYPPVLLHWFKLVGAVYAVFGIPVFADEFLKLWLVLPLLLTFLMLLQLLGRALERQARDPLREPLFWGLAVNPVLWLNGPGWGQVDLLPLLAVVPALLCWSRHKVRWVPALFVVAVSIKFQAIVFAPLLAGLCLRYWRQAIRGLPWALVVFALIWAPFVLGGHLADGLQRAYLGNLGLYPYASLNAANLWYLLVGNMAADQLNLWTGEPALGALETLFTPRWFGTLLFTALSVGVFLAAWRGRLDRPPFALAVLAVLGFFTLAPGMHERYLFMAVPLAAFWATQQRSAGAWFWALSLLCFFNMNLVQPFSGEFVWRLVAGGSVLGLVLMLAQRLGRVPELALERVAGGFERVPAAAWWVSLLAWILLAWNLGQARVVAEPLAVDGMYLSDLAPLRVVQEWGELKFDLSTLDRPLQIGDRVYRKGLGTHARSEIEFEIPPGMDGLRCTVGLDAREGRHGRVRFQVLLDGRRAWQSDVHANRSRAEALELHWAEAARLTLVVQALGSNQSDHANWVDCYLTAGPGT